MLIVSPSVPDLAIRARGGRLRHENERRRHSFRLECGPYRGLSPWLSRVTSRSVGGSDTEAWSASSKALIIHPLLMGVRVHVSFKEIIRIKAGERSRYGCPRSRFQPLFVPSLSRQASTLKRRPGDHCSGRESAISREYAAVARLRAGRKTARGTQRKPCWTRGRTTTRRRR